MTPTSRPQMIGRRCDFPAWMCLWSRHNSDRVGPRDPWRASAVSAEQAFAVLVGGDQVIFGRGESLESCRQEWLQPPSCSSRSGPDRLRRPGPGTSAGARAGQIGDPSGLKTQPVLGNEEFSNNCKSGEDEGDQVEQQLNFTGSAVGQEQDGDRAIQQDGRERGSLCTVPDHSNCDSEGDKLETASGHREEDAPSAVTFGFPQTTPCVAHDQFRRLGQPEQ